MSNYYVEYCWDTSSSVPVLWIVVSGKLLDDPRALATIIDQAHLRANRDKDQTEVYLAYDFSATEGRLPLSYLMQWSHPCPKVKRVAMIGVRARIDEMAVLIMAAAKRVPYECRFFETREDARYFLSSHGLQDAVQ